MEIKKWRYTKKLGLINIQHNRYETIIRENHIQLYTLKKVIQQMVFQTNELTKLRRAKFLNKPLNLDNTEKGINDSSLIKGPNPRQQ